MKNLYHERDSLLALVPGLSEHMSAYVFISVSTTQKPMVRQPLEHILLPVKLASSINYLPQGPVWWVEQIGFRLYLRGRFEVYRATLEREIATQRELVKWHLTGGSERISWPGTRPIRADVSDVLLDLNQCLPNISLHLVGPDLDNKLERRRLNVAERAFSYAVACRQFQNHEQQTRSFRPPLKTAGQAFYKTLVYIHNFFSRAELVLLSDHDPYCVAAAALLGYKDLPDTVATPRIPAASLPFRELDESNLYCIEQEWNRDVSGSQPNSSKLAECTRQHQQILRQLILEV